MSVISNNLVFKGLFVIPEESKHAENKAVWIPPE